MTLPKIKDLKNILPPEKTFADYRAEEGLNFHTLKDFVADPATFKKILDGQLPPEEGDPEAMRIGTQFHQYILQPERFDAENALFSPPINERTGKPYGIETAKHADALAEFNEKNAGKTPYTKEDVERFSAMRAGILENETVKNIVYGSPAGTFRSELAFKGETPFFPGWVLKGSIDRYDETIGIFDLKTTSRIEDSRGKPLFYYGIRDYKYVEQLAFYQIALLHVCAGEAFREYPPAYIIAVEKLPPYRSKAFRIGERTAQRARDTVLNWMEQYFDAVETGVFPSIFAEVEEI